MGGVSIWQLLIILVIVLLLFGAKKLRSVGGDLGSALKGFRGAMKEGEEDALKKPADTIDKPLDNNEVVNNDVIDVKVTQESESKKTDSTDSTKV